MRRRSRGGRSTLQSEAGHGLAEWRHHRTLLRANVPCAIAAEALYDAHDDGLQRGREEVLDPLAVAVAMLVHAAQRTDEQREDLAIHSIGQQPLASRSSARAVPPIASSSRSASTAQSAGKRTSHSWRAAADALASVRAGRAGLPPPLEHRARLLVPDQVPNEGRAPRRRGRA